MRLHTIIAALVALVLGPHGQATIPAPLEEMASAERAFAAAARAKGIRDAFLEFFSDDAIALEPGPVSAKARLLKQPSAPFSERELVWEPRTGDVASSGELGWLTGPSTFINHGSPEKTPRFGNYLSVWRRQPNGLWRVFIDVGTNLPAPAAFAPGFTRFPLESRYAGTEDPASATRTLLAADRDLNAGLASNRSTAYAERLAEAARLHRNGAVPIVGSAAIVESLGRNPSPWSGETGTAEAARSGDLGYSYGTYSPRPSAPRAAYLRIWERDARARWKVVVDVETGGG